MLDYLLGGVVMRMIWFIPFVFFMGAAYLLGTQHMSKETNFNTERTPSSGKVNDNISPILAELKNIQDVSQVEKTLFNVQQKLHELKEQKEAVILIDALNLIQNSKGLFHRVKPIIETNGLTATASVGFLKQIKQEIPVQAKSLHALYDYLFIEPSTETTYKKIHEVQNEVVNFVIPKFEKAISDLGVALKEYPLTKEPKTLFHIDLSILLGDQLKFVPDSFHVLPVTSTHLYVFKAELEETLSHLYYVSSYQLNDLPNILSETTYKNSRKMFWKGFKKKRSVFTANFATQKLLHKNFNGASYRSFLKLRTPAKENKYLGKSNQWLIQSLNSRLEAIHAVSKFKNLTDKIIFSPALKKKYSADALTFTQESLNNLVVKKPVSFVSPINGATFQINPSMVFNPEVMTDLKQFFPSNYDEVKNKELAGKKIINLNYGKPVGWVDPSFAGVLPQTDNPTLPEHTSLLMAHPSTTMLGHWLKLFQ
jgi:hypothetical protein